MSEPVDEEEARVNQTIAKKADNAFEERRRRALEEYERKTGKKTAIGEYLEKKDHASQRADSAPTPAPAPTPSAPAPAVEKPKPKGDVKAYKPVDAYIAPEHEFGGSATGSTSGGSADLASRPAKDFKGTSAAPSASPKAFNAPSTASPAGGKNPNWREQQREKEEAERARIEAQEQAKAERAAALVRQSYGDAPAKKVDWKEEQRLHEEAERRRLEEEAVKREQNASAVAAAGKLKLDAREKALDAAQAAQRERLAQAEAAKHDKVTSFLFCSECGAKSDLATMTKQVDGGFFCRDCHIRATVIPKGPKCAKCKEPVGSSWTVVKNSKYHPGCVACSQCGKQMAAGVQMVIQGPNFFCRECKTGL